jgi:pheromone shutdown protein TraB
MRNRSELAGTVQGSIASIDTTFVLFFLALEYGRAVRAVSIDGLLMGVTMIMVLVLPYFLPSHFEKPAFSAWLLGRGAVALLGFLLGVMMSQAVGVVLPESMRFLPMTFLIAASMVSCYIQFYSLMKLRPVK